MQFSPDGPQLNNHPKNSQAFSTSDTIPHPPIVLSDDEDCEEHPTINSSDQNSDQPSNPSDKRRTQLQQHQHQLDPPRAVVYTDQAVSSDEEERPRQQKDQNVIAHSSPATHLWSVPEDIHTADDVKRLIIAVSKDTTISEPEKNRRRQLLHSALFLKHQRQNDVQFQKKMEQEATCATYSSVIDPETGRPMLGCEHYPRKCKLLAECCKSWVVCRHCHDQQNLGHTMTRFDTKLIMCMLCNREQPVSNKCINPACAVEFARYFCAKCKFYDGSPGKNIYHCDHCRICRVGKGLGHDNFHCSNCDACVSLKYEKDHRCLKRSLDAHCPVCKQYLFTSTKPVVFMKCGHTMHAHCFDEYISSYYTCPLCHKALTNMTSYYNQIDQVVQHQTLPDEIRSRRAEILCHDCGGKCETQFHYLHLKCTLCNSYNTRLIRTFDIPNAPSNVLSHPTSRQQSTLNEESDVGADVDNDNDEIEDESNGGDNVISEDCCEQEGVETLLDTGTIRKEENEATAGHLELAQTPENELTGKEMAEGNVVKINNNDSGECDGETQDRTTDIQGEISSSSIHKTISPSASQAMKKRNRHANHHNRSVRLRRRHDDVQVKDDESQSLVADRGIVGPHSSPSHERVALPPSAHQESGCIPSDGMKRQNSAGRNSHEKCVLSEDEEVNVEGDMELEQFVALHGPASRGGISSLPKLESSSGAGKERVVINRDNDISTKAVEGGSKPFSQTFP